MQELYSLPREFDLLSSLPIDANLAFLVFPESIGKLRYATVQTWQTGQFYVVNVATIDNAERVSTGANFEMRAFWGLYFVKIADGIVSVGSDDPCDLATWKILPDSQVKLCRYGLREYPLNRMLDNDTAAVCLVENLGSNAEPLDYKILTGAEVQQIQFEG